MRRPSQFSDRSWWPVVLCMIAGCGIQFEACEAPRPTEALPVKLWACNAIERRCEVYARFKTTMDCGLYQRFLGSECDPNVPPGHLRCWPAASPTYRETWFNECSREDLTFDQVRDGGGWIR